MFSRDMVGSGEGMEEEDGIGFLLVESAPSGVGETSTGDLSSFTECQVAQFKKMGGGIGHGRMVGVNRQF